MSTKLYRCDKNLQFSVEADSQDEARRTIKKLIDEVSLALPDGVRFTSCENIASDVRAYLV